MAGLPESPPIEPVLDLLAPLRAAYVRRSGPTDRHPRPPVQNRVAERLAEVSFAPCVVEAVVTVDPEGRIPWRLRLEGLRNGAASIEVVDEDIIKVSIGDQPGRMRHAPDRQGRLHLPQGVLRAIGVGPGDRLAVLRLGDGSGVGLVSVNKLGIRRRST